MITQWGMSEALGPIQYGEREEMVFLGRGIAETRNYSDKVAQEIDEEVRKLVDEAHRRCHEILTSYEDRLDAVAAALLEHETLHAPEFQAIMRGEDPFQSVDGVEEPQPRGTTTSERDGNELPREEDSRDQGLDLSGGTLPAPA
jgi:cell division protease FtsH